MMFVSSPTHFTVDRRKFLAGAGALIAAGLLPKNALALAGPHTFNHGDVTIMVLSDGHLTLPVSLIAPNGNPEEVKAVLTALGVTGDKITPAASPALIRAGNEVILFDTGSGPGFQETSGKLKESLAAATIDPASVTKVVYTHAHPDHLFGTSADGGALTFPNATYYVNKAEWDFWTNSELPGKVPEQMKPMVMGAQKHLGAVKEKLVLVKPGDEIAAGITVLDTPGHTPGHASFAVPGEGGGLIIMGDIANHPVVYFAHPEWHFAFDADKEQAVATRKAILDRAATDKVKLVGYHWAYPGVGFAERDGTAYKFVPAM
jgi:glyoxylase-like metal-dependent hydrolase (beta-lactamase superfamily II)